MLTRGQRTSREDEMVAYWNEQAPYYAPRYNGTLNEAHAFRIRLQRVCELFDQPGGRVLDVGCGPGIMAEYLLDHRCETFGVDISEEMVAQCRQRLGGHPSAHFSVGKIESLDFPDGFFDAVTCMGVVEYITDDKPAVRELARVTRPGGTVIITLPNKLSPYRIWDRWVYRNLTVPVKKVIGRRTKSIWHKEYLAGDYSRLLRSHGLVVTDTVYYAFKITPSPLDFLFRRLTVNVSERLEPLYRSKLGWLGTGFIVKAQKL